MTGKGLSNEKANILLQKHGPNQIPEAKPPTNLAILLNQLKSPLVYILLSASVVTLVLGDYADMIIILIAVFINTTLGFIQERKAKNALASLKRLVHPKAEVIRGGVRLTIDAVGIIPGDICIVNQGDKIPADGVFIEANRLFVGEAILTGESLPVEKTEGGEGYMGTVVTSGNGVLKVSLTGGQTSFGKIAVEVQKPDEITPLGKKLRNLSKQLSILVIALVLLVFVIGVFTGKQITEIFTISVALAVSAIPEGLLVALTVVLAIGMQRILKRKGLVRNLVSAETLGSVTTICVDKTGTLTKGEMEVTEVIGNEKDIAKQLILANDLDDPMLISAYEWSKSILGDESYSKDKSRLDSLPFSSKERYFASLHKADKQNVIYVNGAPDHLVEWTRLKASDREEIKQLVERYAKEGKRVMGLARKTVSVNTKKIDTKDIKSNLDWIGLVVFSDPPRIDAGKVFEKTGIAGIKTIVITGDYPYTALSVLESLGVHVDDDQVMLGEELDRTSDKVLSEKLRQEKIKLFARTTPDQKLKIVKALKENGEIVAMMGDGVNDAPALKFADIGIVVSNASDVAKESSDLVLLDSNFETILAAIEEGRGIFDNIRKIISYLLSDSFSEIVAVTGGLLLGAFVIANLPIPVLAAQILWINLVSDGFPHLALTVDPKSSDVMTRDPIDPSEQLVSTWMKYLIGVVSVVGGIVALLLFVYYFQTTSDARLSQSIAFATLGINSLFYVFSIRTLTKPVWKTNIFENKWLNLAVVAGVMLQIFPFLFPVTRDLLKISQLNIFQWTSIVLASVFMFMIIELTKALFRLHELHR